VYVPSQDLFNKTYYPKLEDHQQINKPWYIVDAEVRPLPPTPTLHAAQFANYACGGGPTTTTTQVAAGAGATAWSEGFGSTVC
jgi:hypothetical protein